MSADIFSDFDSFHQSHPLSPPSPTSYSQSHSHSTNTHSLSSPMSFDDSSDHDNEFSLSPSSDHHDNNMNYMVMNEEFTFSSPFVLAHGDGDAMGNKNNLQGNVNGHNDIHVDSDSPISLSSSLPYSITDTLSPPKSKRGRKPGSKNKKKKDKGEGVAEGNNKKNINESEIPNHSTNAMEGVDGEGNDSPVATRSMRKRRQSSSDENDNENDNIPDDSLPPSPPNSFNFQSSSTVSSSTHNFSSENFGLNDHDDDLPVDEKRIRNAQSASQYRQRRKQYVESLEHQVAALSSKCKQQAAIIHQINGEKEKLVEKIRNLEGKMGEMKENSNSLQFPNPIGIGMDMGLNFSFTDLHESSDSDDVESSSFSSHSSSSSPSSLPLLTDNEMSHMSMSMTMSMDNVSTTLPLPVSSSRWDVNNPIPAAFRPGPSSAFSLPPLPLHSLHLPIPSPCPTSSTSSDMMGPVPLSPTSSSQSQRIIGRPPSSKKMKYLPLNTFGMMAMMLVVMCLAIFGHGGVGVSQDGSEISLGGDSSSSFSVPAASSSAPMGRKLLWSEDPIAHPNSLTKMEEQLYHLNIDEMNMDSELMELHGHHHVNGSNQSGDGMGISEGSRAIAL